MRRALAEAKIRLTIQKYVVRTHLHFPDRPFVCGLHITVTVSVTDVPRGSTKHVRFSTEAAIQDLWERAEKILAIRESEELAEEAVRLGRMVSSNAPLY